MVENVENLPEKSTDNSQTAISAKDIAPTDIENFSAINQNMSPDADQALLAFDGASGGPELTGREDFDLTLVDAPEKDSKPESPNDKKPEDSGKEGGPDVEESKDTPFVVGNFGLLGFHPFGERGAQSTINDDGLIEKVEITDSNSKTSFEFSEQGPTITRTTNNAREVTKYSSDGTPESTTIFTPASPEGKEIPVDESNSFSVETIDGKLTLTLKDSDNDTQIDIGPDGKIQSKYEWSDTHKETHYNEDGSASFDATTTFGENGFKQSRRIENDLGITNESYDEHGNWAKSTTNGKDFTQTRTRESDGSILTLTNKTDGSRFISSQQPDGSQYHGQALDGTNILTTVNPDGSRTVSTESNDASTYVISDKDGNWMMYHRNNVSGTVKMTHGDKTGPYKSSKQYKDT